MRWPRPDPVAAVGPRRSSLREALDQKLNKPYYLFRPGQIVRRATLGRRRRGAGSEYDEITSPWGLPLRFRAGDKTGLSYARRGIFDLPVCEVLWRLCEPGEVALDVGANIGQMTSAMAAAVGGGGRVIAFEPHPDVFRELTRNAERWQRAEATGTIELRNLAASSSAGVAELGEDTSFEANAGTASIGRDREDYVAVLRVPASTLDQELGGARVGVMKLDVEGHELEVLSGAERLLTERRIRDVVFEDFGRAPTPVMELLSAHGHSVFSFDQGIWGPTIGPVTAGNARRSGEDPSYLATLDPERALRRLGPRGWGALRAGPYAARRALSAGTAGSREPAPATAS